jgi:hypothetical protein
MVNDVRQQLNPRLFHLISPDAVKAHVRLKPLHVAHEIACVQVA